MARWKSLVAIAVLLVMAAPASAKKNNPNVELDFRPQQAVAAAEADVTPDMLRRPVALRVEDMRRDPEEIGTRTDDDDRKHTLRAVGDVREYAAAAIEELLDDWGVQTDDGAGLILEISLVQIDVLETNQAVGATFSANVRLAAELKGAAQWSGTASGDATRYGKKFSNENVNEVLSDALLEAVANLLSEPGLHQAWEE